MVSKRVHIVPAGRDYDSDRVVDPAVEKEAEILHLLTAETADHGAYDPLIADLEDELIRVHRTPCDHTDIYTVFGLVTTLADQHAGDQVRVNVSASGKRAAIGSTLACMDDSTTATAYFADAPEDAAGFNGSDGATDAVQQFSASPVPGYPIDSPSRDQIAGLAIIMIGNRSTKRMKKRDIIDRGIKAHRESDQGLAFVEKILNNQESDDYWEEFTDLSSEAKRGAYGHLSKQVLDGLLERGYIQTEESGAATILSVTETGENALKAFRHKVVDIIEVLDNPRTPDWLTHGLSM